MSAFCGVQTIRKTKVQFAASLLLAVAVSAGAQEHDVTARIQINPSQQYQQIQGFGVNFTGPYFRNDQKAMFDKLIDDLGVTCSASCHTWSIATGRRQMITGPESELGVLERSLLDADLRGDMERLAIPELARHSPHDRTDGPCARVDDGRQSPPPPKHDVCQPKVPAQPARAPEPGPRCTTSSPRKWSPWWNTRASRRISTSITSAPSTRRTATLRRVRESTPTKRPRSWRPWRGGLKKEGLGDVRLAVADNADHHQQLHRSDS